MSTQLGNRWLVSSGGRRGALVNILRNTPGSGQSHVTVTDASELSSAGRMADDFILVPRVRDADFIPRMVSICRERRIDFLVPTIDTELQAYAESAALFREVGTEVLVSSPEVIALASDKWLFHQWLLEKGLPSPRTSEIAKVDCNAFPAGSVIAKPRGGSSSVGLVRENSLARILQHSLTDDYIIQEAVPGSEFTVDFAVSRTGSFLGAIPRRRLEVRAGEVSKGVTVKNAAIEDLTEGLAMELPNAFGVLNAQLFFDEDSGSLAIIEMNARVGGGFPLSHRAGGEFFNMFASSSSTPLRGWESDLLMLRYDEAVFVPGFRTEGRM